MTLHSNIFKLILDRIREEHKEEIALHSNIFKLIRIWNYAANI